MKNPLSPRLVVQSIWMENFGSRLTTPSKNPKLYVMAGLPLSGKTCLATRIKELSTVDVVYLENDLVRNMLAKVTGKGKPEYTPEEHKLVFRTSHELIGMSLRQGYHTIFDATNLNERYRKEIYHIADEAGAEVLVIKLKVDEEEAQARAVARKNWDVGLGHSEADFSIYEKLKAEDEPIEHCTRPYIVIDTTDTSADDIIRANGLALHS